MLERRLALHVERCTTAVANASVNIGRNTRRHVARVQSRDNMCKAINKPIRETPTLCVTYCVESLLAVKSAARSIHLAGLI